MTKQEKFENYMNNIFAPWALKIVITANLSVIFMIATRTMFKF